MKKVIIFLMCMILFMPSSVNAKRGCCSHHGGVAGCNSDGRQICNDGTLSPTCTCTPVVRYTYGCTDSDAKNYNPSANKNDGSCEYYVYGCTDEEAKNYNSEAEKDDGSCEYYVYGCTDYDAENYDFLADKDDGSCEYKDEEEQSVLSTVESTDAETIEDDSDSGLFVLGVGGTALGIWLYKKKKK